MPHPSEANGHDHAPGAMAAGSDDHGIASAIDRAVDAAQGVIVDQMGLARLEIEQALGALITRAALSALGVVGLVGAWILLLAGAHRALLGVVTPPASFAILGAVNVVLGCIALGVARRRTGPEGHDGKR